MDKRVTALKTPEDCTGFIKNALRLGHPELALQARQRSVQLGALAFNPTTDFERQALEAMYAYESVLSERNGRRVASGRSWPVIKKYGILKAMERAVTRKDDPVNYASLTALGLEEYSFEAVVLRHPELFSEQSVTRSKQRVEGRQSETAAPAPLAQTG